jgi:NADH dehydrogenase (ubiquinone) 1 beta subcomplex subunit 10
LRNSLIKNFISHPESVVEPNQKKYPWYHQNFRRVPTIDQCYTDDYVCIFEANDQFKRDKMVDSEIVNILRKRFEDCVLYEAPDHLVRCQGVLDTYNKASEHWFTKCKLINSHSKTSIDKYLSILDGDLGGYANAKSCYLKQKHRAIWERRHGPVGSGMKTNEKNVADE